MSNKFYYLTLLFILMAISTFKAQVNELINDGKYTTGIIEYKNLVDPSRNNRSIPIKIHYPVSEGVFPVIIISHGAGGNWDTHFAQAHHLASHGYIVLCVEHIGSNTEKLMHNLRIIKNLDEMIHNSDEVLGRPKDISFAITFLTKLNTVDAKLKGKININNIGVMGHSFGAYTTMAIAGIKPALNWLKPVISQGKGLGPDLFDLRVKCAIALSPQGADEPFFIVESFSSLRIPLMGISGTKDQLSSGAPSIDRYNAFSLWPKNNGYNKFVWIDNASHLDFADAEGGERRGLNSKNRDEVQKIVRASCLLYFNHFLKGDPDSEKLITTENLKVLLSGDLHWLEVRVK